SPISLLYQIGATAATNSATQVVTLSNPGTQPLSYQLSPIAANGIAWITTNPSQGTIPANGTTQVTIGYDITKALAAGNYAGTLNVLVPGAASNPAVPVNLLISTQALLILPTSPVSFSYQTGGTLPNAKTVLATTTQVAADAPSGQQMPLSLVAA